MSKKQSGFSVVAVLLILVIVGIIGGTGWYVVQANKNTNDTLNNSGLGTAAKSAKKTTAVQQTQQATTNTAAPSTANPYDGWKKYTSKFGFSFYYPADANISDETDSAATINESSGPNTVDVVMYADGYSRSNCKSSNPDNLPSCLAKVEFVIHNDTSANGVLVNSPTSTLKKTAQLVIDSYKKKS
jgi:cytoskeletal protein RodZ